MRRIIAGTLALLFMLVIVAISRIGHYDMPIEEVAQRCREAQPAWQSYSEDIKGQVGARPVALWRGEVIEARQKGESVEVVFLLEAPWSRWEAAMPILLREPAGNVILGAADSQPSEQRTYRFTLFAPGQAAPLPWIELQYPHAQIRITLDTQGEWKKARVE